MLTFPHIHSLVRKMSDLHAAKRLTVLLDDATALLFDHYCRRNGLKKSTFAAHLIREHLERSNFSLQMDLLEQPTNPNEVSLIR